MDDSEIRKMGKAEFWIRLIVFIGLAVAAPLTFLGISYGLFNPKDEGMTLSGWGILGFAVAAIVLISIINQTKKGLRYGSMMRQCLDGYLALIPLFIFILILHSVKQNIDKLETFMIFLAICEAIAIPVNPIRKWAEQNNIEIAENFLMRCIKRGLGKKD